MWKAIFKRAGSYVLKILFLVSFAFFSKTALLSTHIPLQAVKCHWGECAELLCFHHPILWRATISLSPAAREQGQRCPVSLWWCGCRWTPGRALRSQRGAFHGVPGLPADLQGAAAELGRRSDIGPWLRTALGSPATGALATGWGPSRGPRVPHLTLKLSKKRRAKADFVL